MSWKLPLPTETEMAEAMAQPWLRAGTRLGLEAQKLKAIPPLAVSEKWLLRAQWACRPQLEAMTTAEHMLYETTISNNPELATEDHGVFG